MITNYWQWILVGVAVFIAGAIATWFFFYRSTAELVSIAPTSVDFGTAEDRPGEAGGGDRGNTGATNEPLTPAEGTEQKVFQLVAGPVAGGILIQTKFPTTTLARFMLAESGRVFDLPLDVAGALPRAVSNTTIPGITRTLWAPDGSGVIAQYEKEGLLKTLYVGLLSASTTLNSTGNPQPTRVQYLPDNVTDVALAPDGRSAAYLLRTAAGSDGYIVTFNGAGAKKVFSSPLSQLLLSWPSSNTLLLQTPAADGTVGGAFAVDAKSGAISPLLFANAVSAIADKAFSRVVYQTVVPGSTVRSSFVHDIAKNSDQGLSFSPIPEKCVWPATATSTLFCATPMQYAPPNYLDLWHLGLSGMQDTVASFDIATGKSTLYATPGVDGGLPSDMVELALSPDQHYLTFVKRGDRSLWGVRLTETN